jgi:lipoprotein
MFRNCNSLTSLDLSKWNTSKLKDMPYMFLGCNLLTYIDLSEWDTSKVTNIYSAFNGCSSLTTITGVIDLKNCTDYSDMFLGCNNLTSVKVKNLPVDIDTFCTRANIDKSKVIVV